MPVWPTARAWASNIVGVALVRATLDARASRGALMVDTMDETKPAACVVSLLSRARFSLATLRLVRTIPRPWRHRRRR